MDDLLVTRLAQKQREQALYLLRFPEGEFARWFLETFIRADSANLSLLSDDFEVLWKKFGWDEKLRIVLEWERDGRAPVKHKTCPKCGRKEWLDDFRFCPLDGAELVK